MKYVEHPTPNTHKRNIKVGLSLIPCSTKILNPGQNSVPRPDNMDRFLDSDSTLISDINIEKESPKIRPPVKQMENINSVYRPKESENFDPDESRYLNDEKAPLHPCSSKIKDKMDDIYLEDENNTSTGLVAENVRESSNTSGLSSQFEDLRMSGVRTHNDEALASGNPMDLTWNMMKADQTSVLPDRRIAPPYNGDTRPRQSISVHQDSVPSKNHDKMFFKNALQEDNTILKNTLQEDSTLLKNTLQQDSTPLKNTMQQDSTPLKTKLQEDSTPLKNTLQQDSTPLKNTLQQDSTPIKNNLQQYSTSMKNTLQQAGVN